MSDAPRQSIRKCNVKSCLIRLCLDGAIVTQSELACVRGGVGLAKIRSGVPFSFSFFDFGFLNSQLKIASEVSFKLNYSRHGTPKWIQHNYCGRTHCSHSLSLRVWLPSQRPASVPPPTWTWAYIYVCMRAGSDATTPDVLRGKYNLFAACQKTNIARGKGTRNLSGQGQGQGLMSGWRLGWGNS